MDERCLVFLAFENQVLQRRRQALTIRIRGEEGRRHFDLERVTRIFITGFFTNSTRFGDKNTKSDHSQTPLRLDSG